jgi:hypothetical protein
VLTGETPALADTLCRVAARERWLAVRADDPTGEPGWHRTADLLDAGRLTAVVDDGARALASEHPRASPAVRRAVAAALLVNDWCWALGVVGAGSLAVDRRVPDLPHTAVHLRVDGARVTGVALTSSTFACAADDPSATGRVVADLDDALREAIAAHLAPLHAALRAGTPPLLRRGPRAMCAAAGDGIAAALRLHADGLGEMDGARVLAVANRLLTGAPRAWGSWGFGRLADASGSEHLTRQRASCCLYYRLPGAPTCITCPRTGDDERAARLAAGV